MLVAWQKHRMSRAKATILSTNTEKRLVDSLGLVFVYMVLLFGGCRVLFLNSIFFNLYKVIVGSNGGQLRKYAGHQDNLTSR